MHNTRETRIAELEDLLVDTERQLISLHRGETDGSEQRPPPPPPPAPSSASPPPPPPRPPSSPVFRSDSRPDSPQASDPAGPNLAGAEFLLRYGGISLVVASAIFFVSTAINRGWIGPNAQLIIATLTSLGIIAQSFRFSAEQRPWTITLAIGGTAALFATGVVGFVGLEILTFPAAITWLLASIALFLALSKFHNAQSIAIASVPAALVGALLLFTGEFYEPMLLGIIGGLYTLAIVFTTHGQSWFIARALGVSTGAFLGGIAVLDAIIDSHDTNLILLGLITIAAVLVGTTSQALDFRSHEGAVSVSPAALIEARFAALTVPYIAAVVAGIVSHLEIVSIDGLWISAFVAIGLGLVVAAVRQIPETMRLLHICAAITTVAISLVGVVDGPVLLVALLGQAILAGFLAIRFDSTDMKVLTGVLAGAVTVLSAGYLTIGVFDHGLTTGEMLAVLIVVIASAFGAKLLRDRDVFPEAWYVTWALTMVWVVASFRDVDQGQMIITLLWALVGSAMVLLASRLIERQMMSIGLFSLTVTAGKLILVDLVAVDILWRAGLFFVVGMLFMRLAFMLPKLMGTPKVDASDEVIEPQPQTPQPEPPQSPDTNTGLWADSGAGLG